MIRVLGDAYTMDPEVVPRPYKIFDWLYIELVSGSLRFTPREKKCHSDDGGSPKDTFKGLYYPLTWSNMFCGGIGNKIALVKKKDKGP